MNVTTVNDEQLILFQLGDRFEAIKEAQSELLGRLMDKVEGNQSFSVGVGFVIEPTGEEYPYPDKKLVMTAKIEVLNKDFNL